MNIPDELDYDIENPFLNINEINSQSNLQSNSNINLNQDNSEENILEEPGYMKLTRILFIFGKLHPEIQYI